MRDRGSSKGVGLSAPGRRGRRTVVTAAFLVFAALTASACADAEPPSLFASGKVSVGTKNDQPGTGVVHTYKFSGFDITVARQILKSVGAEPDFGIVPSEDRTTVLTEKKKDLVVATFSITVERMKRLDFVGPYASTYQGIMVRKDDRRIRRPDDLFGKRVCTWPGTTSATTLQGPEYSRIAVYERPDASSCINDLKVTKVADAVSTDQMILYGFTQENPDLRVVPDLTYGSANHYGIALAKGHRADCLKLRDALRDYIGGNNWSHDFSTSLWSIPKADPRWETDYKPRLETIDSLSCRDQPRT
ncbi:putative ABC transporter substrate-binding protein [Streptomyces sp. NBRC 110611]|uniref:transporter substrate-binding domain-containing protein n=1 Tax=Streptomyces sp. NBRC 110611 TaxID=1621259 RepID=UPI0008574084|nr:transporter substrate-binding domain-containing protein [Streptomyces sp. NBRC 110611]GAU69410.1 putative ABC transporter substrate-binding protein [Streptomyces sp. NBRC 110611]